MTSMTHALPFRNHLFLLLLAATVTLVSVQAAWVADKVGSGRPSTAVREAPMPERAGLKGFKTFYAYIYYADDRLIEDFSELIGRQGGFQNPGTVKAGPARAESEVKKSLDKIVFRVRTLLDMYPSDFHFSIMIHGGYEELKEAYGATGMIGRAPIAFYSHSDGTIHVTVERLTAGILAHEIAHAVINAYFETPPPAKMQEILSQYVDKHLWDE